MNLINSPTQVIINKHDVMVHYYKWREDNLTVMHPLTTFLEIIGLKYKQLYRSDSWSCEVADKAKYMLAKIKYGI